MKKKLRYILSILVLVLSLLGGCSVSVEVQDTPSDETEDSYVVTEESDTELDKESDSEIQSDAESDKELTSEILSDTSIDEDGEYTSRDDVAVYLYLYQHLPSNFITKKEAKALGWESQKGNLGEVAPGKSIGGDYFGNYEGILPEAEGREYHECDIDSDGGYRGAKRIVYSNDGLIYYTEDHYETFTLLYGEEE